MRIGTITSITALVLWFPITGVAEEINLAGVTPDQRPQNAPVVTILDKDGDWYTRALAGVNQPYPHSLRFLEDQGNWFIPFIHPGMTGPYDIRGWHKKK